MNLESFSGPKVFGRAYQCMLENDTHVQGSVDREIALSMIRLCNETASHLYDMYTDLHVGYVAGSRPGLENFLSEAKSLVVDPMRQVAVIAKPISMSACGSAPSGFGPTRSRGFASGGNVISH